MIGALLYLANGTRPDLAFAVGRLARLEAAPTTAHLAELKVGLRYVHETAKLALHYNGAAELPGTQKRTFPGTEAPDSRHVPSYSHTTGLRSAWGVMRSSDYGQTSRLQAGVCAYTTTAREPSL